MPNQQLKNYAKEDITETPCGDFFVKPHVKKGILPMILEELIAAREQVNRELA